MSEQGALPLPDPGGDWAGNVEMPDSKWPAALAELVDVLATYWLQSGADAQTALIHAQQVVVLIADYRGGRSLYLPRGDRLRIALRAGSQLAGVIAALDARIKARAKTEEETVR